MDAILLCMKKRGIRFFSKLRFQNSEVVKFYERKSFLKALCSRYRKFDNVLLIAHGSDSAILTTTNDLNKPYTVYITSNEAHAFKNDFVFAVSCLTANEFGKCCVERGAIAYLGYQAEIGCLFYSYSVENRNFPKRITYYVDIMIKRIFVEELSRVYEEFLTSPISVRVLKERFSYQLEHRIAQLTDIPTTQLNTKYGIKLTERDSQKYVVEVILRMLSYLNDILPKLVCIGDENYISASYLTYRRRDGFDSKQLSEELEANHAFQSIIHDNYKQHLRELASK